MDRIDSYIQQTFAKFRDVPEIQAQKEEMADHLRDRIADAIGQGKSEKEAFASATAAISDAMPDLEQTLAGFLRPEFQRDGKPKPNTKEIYINFYRYHRAMMLMFAQVLFTLMVLGFIELPGMSEHLTMNMIGVIFWVNIVFSIIIVYSTIAYILNPLRIKRVSISSRSMIARYFTGALAVYLVTLLFALSPFCGGPNYNYVMFGLVWFYLLFYSLFFIVFLWLGWFRQSRYSFAPTIKHDMPMAQLGLLLASVFFLVTLFPILNGFSDRTHYIWETRLYGLGGADMVGRIHHLMDSEKRLQQHNQYLQNELNIANGFAYDMPRDAYISGEPDMYPMGSFGAYSTVYLNRKAPSMLKEGTAAQVFDPVTYRSLWAVPSVKGDYKIIDTEIRFIPEGLGSSSGVMMGGMGSMMPSGGMMMDGMSAMGSGSGVGPPPDLPERKEHQLTLDSDFPATDLAENVICARQFPFEEYKLGMIQAAAPETVEPGETFPVRIGVGNLDAKNAKLLLTVGYDDGLQQEAIPTGSTLFLGFVGAREYREYKTDFTAVPDANGNHNNDHNGEHTLRLTLRNESGQVIAETNVVINTSPQPQ